jgi:hypothetical protein
MVRTKEEIRAELSLLDEQRISLNKKIREVTQELADALAEFKVGQRVIETSYAGTRETEYEISAVDLYFGTMRYRGKKVLKSGALHKCEVTLYGDIAAKEQS